MKVILIFGIPDALVEAEGRTVTELVQEFEALKGELINSAPDGTSVTMRIEASDPKPFIRCGYQLDGCRCFLHEGHEDDHDMNQSK